MANWAPLNRRFRQRVAVPDLQRAGQSDQGGALGTHEGHGDQHGQEAQGGQELPRPEPGRDRVAHDEEQSEDQQQAQLPVTNARPDSTMWPTSTPELTRTAAR